MKVIEKNNSLLKLKLGGIWQWIMVRGDKSKPLLLFLHGGPGTPQISYARHFQKDLEKHFLVVNWDQRGSGLSYSKDIPKDSMNVNQFINDTIELSAWLCEKYDKRKIYLAGYSWGSLLGLLTVQKRPDLFFAFYSISQVINVHEEEKAAFDHLLHDEKSNFIIKKLLHYLGRPPWNSQNRHILFSMLLELKKSGFSHQLNTVLKLVWFMICSPQYKISGLIKFLIGQRFSSELMTDELQIYDVIKHVPSIEVPCIFLAGNYDLITPGTVLKRYYQILNAPYKEWIWFQHSAHSPHLEETEKFSKVVIKTAIYH